MQDQRQSHLIVFGKAYYDAVDLDNPDNQGFEGNPQSLSDSSWLSTTGYAICKNVNFDFQPTNPQTDIMPTWQ
eukprot:1158861-Pelagomonas_calceolata.AAC.4